MVVPVLVYHSGTQDKFIHGDNTPWQMDTRSTANDYTTIAIDI